MSPAWLPAFDLALIKAGESSGGLDVCFRFLTEYYTERARLARQILSDLAYPAFILHMAILIFPTGLLIRLVWQGDVVGFVQAKLADTRAALSRCFFTALLQPGKARGAVAFRLGNVGSPHSPSRRGPLQPGPGSFVDRPGEPA